MITPKDLRTITPSSRINAKVYQLDEGQTLYLGGLARVDFVRGPHQPFVVYVANSLNIHRTKLERADELLAKHHGELLAPPTGKEAASQLPPFVRHSFKIPPNGSADIVISGLGWVTLQGKQPAYVEVHAPKGVSVGIRRALI
jgi:ribosome biogenesis GTPase A